MALAPPPLSEEEVRRRLGRTFEVMATMQGNTILVSVRRTAVSSRTRAHRPSLCR